MFIRSKIYSEVCSKYSYSWTQYDHRKQRRII